MRGDIIPFRPVEAEVQMDAALLWAATGLYGLGLALTLPSIVRRRARLSAGSLAALAAGLALHGAWLAGTALANRRLPVSDVRGALSLFSFLVTLAFFFAYLRYRVASLGLFMLPLVFLLTLISALHPVRSLDSARFRGGWLAVHIGATILGYTGFFLTFVAAVMYLIQEHELKSKKPRAFYYRLPALEVCDELYDRSLLFGLPSMSLGIVTGFVWASRAWRGPWAFDPKILASLVTWLIYLTLFSTRLSSNWRGRRAAYVAIFGFAAVMVTFVGISLVSGQHGYFPTLGGKP